MTPEPICIDLTDGSSFSAMVHVESEKLHINLGWMFGAFVIKPESARQVCRRILDMLGPERCLDMLDEKVQCTLNRGHEEEHVGYDKTLGPVRW